MSLAHYVGTLNLLGDESRIRLCALLRERELSVTDLVRVTGISQSRVSTHLARLREGGFVRDRREGQHSFYAARRRHAARHGQGGPRRGDALGRPDARGRPAPAAGARRRAARRAARVLRRGDASATTRRAAPGSRSPSGSPRCSSSGTCSTSARATARPPAYLAPYCRSLTCIDTSAADDRRGQGAARAATPNVRAQVADVHDLPFRASSFDSVIVFHTLTYAEHPQRALEECARVLRPGGRLVVLSLDEHEQRDVTAPYGERHPGFSPRALRGLLSRAGLARHLRRGGLSRGQEAALPGRAGHRREARSPGPRGTPSRDWHDHRSASASPSARTQLLRSRIAIIDGAMGTTIRTYGMKEADIRGERFADAKKDLLNNGDLFSLTQPKMIGDIHRRFLEAGRRHHRDQHLRRDEHRPERVLRRRSARARRPEGPGVLPEDHRRPVSQRPGLGDQRAVGAAVPRVGRPRGQRRRAAALRRRAPSGRSPSRSRTRPTPTTPASAW